MRAELVGSTLKEEEMRHPPTVWTDPDFAKEPLDKLVAEYIRHLEGRSHPVSPATIDKYHKSMLSLMRSMQRQKVALMLESLTPAVVNYWVSEQRKMGLSEVGISTRLGTVKIFTNKYLFKHLELTTRDLLLKVPRFTPPEKPAPVLSEEEIQVVLETFNLPTYTDIRNKALVATYIATGLRLREVLELPYSSLDRATGEIKFIRAKGNKERCAWLSNGALKHVRAYLRIRPKTADDHRLWIQDDGTPLSVSGLQSVMWRLKNRCGIARLHWHLFRHGFAQNALRKGADMGTVQEMLGHTSNAMTRRYAGQMRQIAAARKMPQYAPI